MLSAGDYQIVVTTYDGAGIWRDHRIDQRDIRDVAMSPNERDIRCFSPTFWSDIPHPAHIGHVEVTAKGVHYRLSWPPPEDGPAPPPALSMHIRLRSAPDEMPSAVEWSGTQTC